MEANVIHDAGQTKFMRRMRFHQSWYRKYRLGQPAGTNPYAKDHGALYGSRLRDDAANSGRNFLTSEIFEVAMERLAENRGIVNQKDKSRLLCDLLSSQPMCFNLLAPLALDLGLATRLVRSLPGVPPDVLVVKVALEYAPEKRTHLQDATSHDAFIEYSRTDGQRGFIGIETKLTEPFSQSSYAFDERYSQWMKSRGWWWKEQAEQEFAKPKCNQLWRNHLLAFSMLKQEPPSYQEAFAAVLYHDEDTSCPDAMKAYRQHLLPEAQGTLLDWPLSVLLDAWSVQVNTPSERAWFDEFRLRYWDLAASEPAWDSFQQAKKGSKA